MSSFDDIKTWLTDSGLYTSPTASDMPRPPTRTSNFVDLGDAIVRKPDITVVYERNWIQDEYFWSVYAPEKHQFSGPFLEVLEFGAGDVPATPVKGGWGLPASKQDEWKNLEMLGRQIQMKDL